MRTLHRRLGGAAAAVSMVLLVVLAGSPQPSATASAHGPRAAAASDCGPPPTAASEPSGQPPLAPNSFRGWTRIYCTDFLGANLPAGWEKFRGVPKGDPAGEWLPSHVTVQDGMLLLTTSRDAANANKWVTGGTCLCLLARKDGAFFVRSRLTNGGPASVQLLWPKNNTWPPELDFYESWQTPNNNTYTVHWSSADHKMQGWLTADMTKWHTWGVIWTPTEIEFVVDWGGTKGWGVWGRVTNRSAIPTVPMTLDLQQESWCTVAPACPTKPSQMKVDWVTVFAPTTNPPTMPAL